MRTITKTMPGTRVPGTVAIFLTAVAFGSVTFTTPSFSAIPHYVISGGGTQAAGSPNFAVRGTLGQPVAGLSTNVVQRMSHGYWFNPYATVSGVNDAPRIPFGFTLRQNHPNPFNPLTRIDFALPAQTHVRLLVFDARGAEVLRLVDRSLSAGPHSVDLDATDLGSGVYFYRLEALGSRQTRKLVLLK